MGKALITGASGFIGGHLAEALLRQGEDVRCLVRRTSQLENLDRSGIELVYGDLHDREALAQAVAGVDTVYHVAGVTHALRKKDFWDVNEQGTQNLVEACARQPNPPVHLYISSIAASGPVGKGEVRTEEQTPQPISNYGRSKLAGELVASRYSQDVPTTIVRPGIVFGPRNLECFPIFQTIHRFRIHPVPGLRAPALSYIHIDDLVWLLIEAARRGKRLNDSAMQSTTGIYFATATEHPTYTQFGRMIGRSIERPRAWIIPVPMPALYACATISEGLARMRGKANLFNIDKMREANVWSWACSSARATRELSYQPRATLEEHIAATVEWYRQEGWLPAPRDLRVSGTARRQSLSV